MTDKPKRGRPKSAAPYRTPPRSIRVTDENWARWQAAAEARGVSVTELIHERMKRA